MKILQIGTNNANDDLTNIVRTFDPSQIDLMVLVEPLSRCNETINACYAGYDYVIENVVINNDDVKEFETFYTSDVYNRLSSLSKEHILKHMVAGDFDADIKEIIVPSLTINKLFDKHNIDKLDILFVDAEGFDHAIIKSIDFQKYQIDKIYYENIHGDNPWLHEFLESIGYEVQKCSFQDGLTNVAILKR